MASVRHLFWLVLACLALGPVLTGRDGGQSLAQQAQPAAPQGQQAPAAKPAPAAPAQKKAPPQNGAQAQPGAEAPPAPAEPAPPPPPTLSASDQQSLDELRQPIMELQGLLGTLEGSVEQNKENDSELARIRAELVDLVQKSQNRLATLKEKTGALRQQFDKLKPTPPAEGEAAPVAPESEQVAAERARLGLMLSEIDGAQKTGELVQVRARQLQTEVQKLRQDIFTKQLFYRSASPLRSETWTKLRLDIPGAWRQIEDVAGSWFAAAAKQWIEVLALIIGAILFYVAVKLLVRRFVSYQLDAPRAELPGFIEQAATIAWVAPVLALPALGAIGVVAGGLDALGLLAREIGPIAERAFVVVTVFAAIRALTYAVLQPRRPDWRMIGVETPVARRLTRLITGIAFVFSLDSILQEVISRLYLPLSINALETIFASVLVALLLLALVKTRIDLKGRFEAEPGSAPTEGQPAAAAAAAGGAEPEPEPHPERVSLLRPFLIKLPALLAAIAILVTSGLGYVGIARLISTHVVLTGGAIAIVLVIHLAIRSMLQGPVKALLEARFGIDPAQSVAFRRGLSVVLNIGLGLVAIPLVLVSWGYTTHEALTGLRTALFGFEIGEVRISPARILIAIGLFLALVFATRIIQRWLDKGVLRSQRMDQGIANSIRTAVGYTGFIVAALAAIAYGGIDITNFAIVAGALSVGIGFGLQSIVNNFVSGLILLVERPIKVGDRVTIGDQEGYVRRISVRATEVETFDRSSVIVPNSELISNTVTNWTHRNALGRALITVSASYNSDPEQVRDILLKVASETPLVLQYPAPAVAFDNFGADGLDFVLLGFVADVNNVWATRSEMRYRVFKAFKDEGIEIPFPQRDLHLRDLDGLKVALQRLAEERAAQQARDAAEPEPDAKPAD